MGGFRIVAALTAISSLYFTPIGAIPLEERDATPSVTSSSAADATTSAVQLPNKAGPISGTIITGSSVPGTSLTAGQPIPSGYYNPNGAVFNPNDYTAPAINWPGKPTAGQQDPPPRPTVAPFSSGGVAAPTYKAPAWVSDGQSGLVASLPQSVTNGNSQWGLLNQTSSTIQQRSIHGIFPRQINSTLNGTDLCGTMPDTGVTRQYTFTVSYQKIAPDGVVKNGLVVNGGFPGPLIEANWGDWIEVTVNNALTDEGTSLHWHGFVQNGTPWFDGVPSVSQCPIPPGGSQVYRFRADQYGSSWYHSHYSAQYSGGALGPIVVHGPTSETASYDVDIGPVMLSDWYHADYFTLVNNTMNGIVPASNNNLINGKMNYPCANTTQICTPNAGISKFNFETGKRYRLRLINTSGEGMQKFTIDGHNFTVIANDFVPVTPYETNVITLGVGQRTDVVVLATGQTGDAYWMRADLGTLGNGCSVTDGVSPEGVAAVYYQGANTTAEPTTQSGLTTAQLNDCGNDPLVETTALCPITPDPAPPTTETIDIVFKTNGTNFVWFMNNSSFRGDYNSPVLQDANQGNLSFPAEWNVYNFGSNSSVRLIVKNHFQFGAHPMHLHGHNFHVLAEGFGDWDGVVVNPQNTQRRDVQLVRPAQSATVPSYIVLQWTQDNPAVWPFHCHIAWHVSGGLYINVLERPDDIRAMTLDPSVQQVCSAWDAWTSANVPDQIDSGLRI